MIDKRHNYGRMVAVPIFWSIAMPQTKPNRKASFDKWYENHKLEFNASRRKKYLEDQELRDTIIRRQREYRIRMGSPYAGIHKRLVKGAMVDVMRIGDASEYVGRNAGTIRMWEETKVIPLPSVSNAKHRYYTHSQVKLMRELAELIDMLRYTDKEALPLAITKKSSEIHLLWET